MKGIVIGIVRGIIRGVVVGVGGIDGVMLDSADNFMIFADGSNAEYV